LDWLCCRYLGNRQTAVRNSARCVRNPCGETSGSETQCKETETFEAYVIGTAPAVYLGIVTTTRQSTWSVLLITGLLALMGGPLFAAAPHEVCDAMHHSCAKLEAVTSCCCGDRSDANPSQVPSGRTDVPDYGHAVTVAAVTFHLPTVTIPFVQVGALLHERPPDLRILFSDLRI